MNSTTTQIRQDIPQVLFQPNEHTLIYLDNAATTPKPQCVIDSQVSFYSQWNSNIHRSGSWLSGKATEMYEQSREKVKDFINAQTSKEIVFTKGCTESINLVASSLNFFKEGDIILLTELEHHSNLLPWLQIAKQKKLCIRYIPVNQNGRLNLSELDDLLKGVKLVAISHISNVIGKINPLKQIIQKAHKNNSLVLVDGSQAVGHISVDVIDLDCDFYCFSGHKMYAPTGVGVLYVKENNYQYLDLYQLGGGMVKAVNLGSFVPEDYPMCFEAGTPNIAGVIGLGVAIDWLKPLLKNQNVIQNSQKLISAVQNSSLQLIAKSPDIPIFAFNLDNINSFDLEQYLSLKGICARSGRHCASPLLQKLQVDNVLRISCGIYNTVEELTFCVESVNAISKMLTP